MELWDWTLWHIRGEEISCGCLGRGQLTASADGTLKGFLSQDAICSIGCLVRLLRKVSKAFLPLP
jgi:hypothetical protein